MSPTDILFTPTSKEDWCSFFSSSSLGQIEYSIHANLKNKLELYFFYSKKLRMEKGFEWFFSKIIVGETKNIYFKNLHYSEFKIYP